MLIYLKMNYRRLPRRPPFLRVESDGIGVTSSAIEEKRKILNTINVNFYSFSYYYSMYSWNSNWMFYFENAQFKLSQSISLQCITLNKRQVWIKIGGHEFNDTSKEISLCVNGFTKDSWVNI